MSQEEPLRAELVESDPLPFHERRGVIIGLMLLAALFLGFPFLWRSRAFSLGEKIFWTIVVLIETVLIFWGFWAVMEWCLERIQSTL